MYKFITFLSFFIAFLSFFIAFSSAKIAAQGADTLKLMSYNLLNFPNGRNDCGSNTVVPARWDTLRKITDYIRPDVLMVCELQTEAGADSILNRALNVGGQTAFRRANFVLNRSAVVNRDLNNMFFYNSQKLALISQSELLTDTRDVGFYRTFLKESGMNAATDTIFIDFYVAHFKASAADSLSRAASCQLVHDHILAQPAGRRQVFGGDFNFYSADESGYLILMQALRDPINQAGAWTNNAAFAPVHTQATRSISPFFDCGSVGGIDDRFDFILLGDSALSSREISYLSGTYNALGNNGSSFNGRINAASNTSGVPLDVRNALFYMSDHLPISLKLATPAISTIFPITLSLWQGAPEATGHNLTWQMGAIPAGQAVDFFEIETSEDAMNFETLARVDGSAGQLNYSYFRANIDGFRYYRLRWQAVSGQAGSSAIIAVEADDSPQLWLLYPNPAGVEIYIKSPESLENVVAEFSFYDALGRLVMQQNCGFERRFAQVNIAALPAGVYIFERSPSQWQSAFYIAKRLVIISAYVGFFG
jgi:endonuclease/exonuclease/phosphatase family metal-dependent hydrolase